MKEWTPWEGVCHQVAVCGCVLDADNKPISGAQVTITAMPKEFDWRVKGAASAAGTEWEDWEERLDRTVSRADGIFYFLDLPGGGYTVRAIHRHTMIKDRKWVVVELQDEKRVSVSWRHDKDGTARVTRAVADLKPVQSGEQN